MRWFDDKTMLGTAARMYDVIGYLEPLSVVYGLKPWYRLHTSPWCACLRDIGSNVRALFVVPGHLGISVELSKQLKSCITGRCG
jgi:hypothetical protein